MTEYDLFSCIIVITRSLCSEQAAFVKKIETLCNTALPTEKRGGVSDANIIASQGIPTLDGWGPYGDGDHTVHERASKKSFEERIALVTQVFEHFLQGEI